MSPVAAYVVQCLVTCVVVAVVAFALLMGARQVGAVRNSPSVRLLARLGLDGRRAVYVVKVADQVLILGGSDAGLNLLGKIDPGVADAMGSSGSGTTGWSRWFSGRFKVAGNRVGSEPSGSEGPHE